MEEISKISKNYQKMLDTVYKTDIYGDPIASEDLSIIHADGTRSCLNWELSGKGFHIVDLENI